MPVLVDTEISTQQHLKLLRPLLGFPLLDLFALVGLEDSGSLFKLCSLQDASVSFAVVRADVFFPEYQPLISDEDTDLLAAREDTVGCLVILNTKTGALNEATANLKAPLVVNLEKGTMLQSIVLDEWPVKAPLMP